MPLRRFGSVTGAALACLAAWWLPSAKADAAFGRYSYAEFMIALSATGVFVATCCVAFAPLSRRRIRVFKILAVSLGSLAALAAVEIYAALAAPKENPFYDFNEGGITADEPLDPRIPFTRPPYLKWEGWSQGDVPEWMPDPAWYRRRIVFQTDSEGFRNSRDIAQADLIFIGDSYTEAGNVLEEETFVRRTAAKLDRTARNLGLFNYAPQPELLIMQSYGLKCDPKAVVWQISESNDLRGAMQYDYLLQNWETKGRPRIDRTPQFRHTSREQRSPTFRLFRSLVKKERWWLAGTVRDAAGGSHEMRFAYWPTEHHYPLGRPGVSWGQGEHPAWGLLADAIRNAKTQLDQRGIKLVILFVPMKLTVFAERVEWDAWSLSKAPRPLVVPAEQSLATQLERLCEESGVLFIDPTPELEKAAAAGELVYFLNDTHLSPRGHEIVSDLIVNVLKDVLAHAE